ncbi:GrpB family protein [Actinoplanes sp. NBRC 103695]|uniref:GrpB family protein n=1 Tax=Actinoplanes sp. NBRC 103695 TaxID=3032202 RepID=UPI0024A0CB5E|nr:GrpB family protein [Actinoplanes sp. NBRC 103695]GLY96429.1 hypothetical protein Acsp02_36840 [Actinoplanes sp. NBRC 103695]
MTELRRAADLLDAATTILARERRRLAGVLTAEHELVLVGGSSVAGALTKGDVDLHLRVPESAFPDAVAALTEIYDVVLPEIWQPTLATFAVKAALPTGVAATPIGSEHDVRFTRTWRRLAADPALVDAYNELKLRHRNDPREYELRKSAFFDKLAGKTRPAQSDQQNMT